MPDFLEQFGERLAGWSGQPVGGRLLAYYIYKRDEQYTAIGLIEGSFYSQPFDHEPDPQEVEEFFREDERFKKHFRS